MLRVLGTLRGSQFSKQFSSQVKDIGTWVTEIHSAMYPYLVRTSFPTLNDLVDESSYLACTLQQPNGLFKNYADMTTGNSTRNFDDASSSALLAATVYRLVLLTGNKQFVPEAERTRAAIFATNGTMASAAFSPSSPSSTSQPSPSPSSSTSDAFANTPHFTSDGWLSPVVDPLNVGVEGGKSPEGEAFALMLHAAWRDWSAAGSPGAPNAAPPSLGMKWMFRGGGVPVLTVAGLVVAFTFGGLLV